MLSQQDPSISNYGFYFINRNEIKPIHFITLLSVIAVVIAYSIEVSAANTYLSNFANSSVSVDGKQVIFIILAFGSVVVKRWVLQLVIAIYSLINAAGELIGVAALKAVDSSFNELICKSDKCRSDLDQLYTAAYAVIAVYVVTAVVEAVLAVYNYRVHGSGIVRNFNGFNNVQVYNVPAPEAYQNGPVAKNAPPPNVIVVRR
jgi:hypothetical protein